MAAISKAETGKWLVRWREPGGRAGAKRERTFRLRREADGFAAKVENEKNQGLYTDPQLGRVTFGEYAEL